MTDLRMCTVHDACEILHLGRTTLYKLADAGEITMVKVLSRTRIRHSDLAAFLARQDETAVAQRAAKHAARRARMTTR